MNFFYIVFDHFRGGLGLCTYLTMAVRLKCFNLMTIPFAALKAQKGMKPECHNADFKIVC